MRWAPSRGVPAAPWAPRGSAGCRGWLLLFPLAPRAPGVPSCPRGRPTRRAPPRCSPCTHTRARALDHQRPPSTPTTDPQIRLRKSGELRPKSQIRPPKPSTRTVLSPPQRPSPPPARSPASSSFMQAPPEPAQPQQPVRPPTSLLPLPTPSPHAPLEAPQRLLGAGHAVEEPFSPPVVAVPAAEAHPGRQLQLDIVGFFGPRPQELEAALGVEEDGVGVLLVVGYGCLEGVELPRGEQDTRASPGQNPSRGAQNPWDPQGQGSGLRYLAPRTPKRTQVGQHLPPKKPPRHPTDTSQEQGLPGGAKAGCWEDAQHLPSSAGAPAGDGRPHTVPRTLTSRLTPSSPSPPCPTPPPSP